MKRTEKTDEAAKLLGYFIMENTMSTAQLARVISSFTVVCLGVELPKKYRKQVLDTAKQIAGIDLEKVTG